MKTSLAILLTVTTALAGNYYVDFSTGSDAGNGTSTATPWQHCPGDTNATGNAASATLASGDVVYFKGGVSYKGKITCSASGAPGVPVTYDGNSNGLWGTGPAIIDGEYQNDANRQTAFVASQKSNLTIQNFTIQHQGGGITPAQWPNYSYPTNPPPVVPGYGVYLTDITNIVIRDCLFKEMGIWTNGQPRAEEADAQEFVTWGIHAYGVDGLTVTNCEFTAVETCIYVGVGYPSVNVCTNVTIAGCNFHNYIRWMIALAGGIDGASIGGFDIRNNQFHDCMEYGFGTATSLWHGYPTNAGPHMDSIFLDVAANNTNKTYGTFLIRNNTFWQNTTNTGGGNFIMLSSMGGDVRVYNNVFLNTGQAPNGPILIQDGPQTGCTPPHFTIFNNTFAVDRYGVFIRNQDYPLWPMVGTNLYAITNNIFYRPFNDAAYNVVVYQVPTAFVAQCDYNLYYTGRPDGLVCNVLTNGGSNIWMTPANMQSQFGWEAHGLVGDPKFANFTYGFGEQSSLNNVHLLAGSPAIASGINLASFFTDDKDGVTRTPPWDIGAYAYSMATPARLSVGTLRVGTLRGR